MYETPRPEEPPPPSGCSSSSHRHSFFLATAPLEPAVQLAPEVHPPPPLVILSEEDTAAASTSETNATVAVVASSSSPAPAGNVWDFRTPIPMRPRPFFSNKEMRKKPPLLPLESPTMELPPPQQSCSILFLEPHNDSFEQQQQQEEESMTTTTTLPKNQEFHPPLTQEDVTLHSQEHLPGMPFLDDDEEENEACYYYYYYYDDHNNNSNNNNSADKCSPNHNNIDWRMRPNLKMRQQRSFPEQLLL